VKRLLTLAIVAIAAGVAATGCNLTPQAALVNGATISVSSLNSQLQTIDTTQAGQCFLEAETGQEIETSGTGGPGTFDMGFAAAILQSQVSDELASQLAASKGLTITAADLATAQNTYDDVLDGQISQVAEASQSAGTASYCVGPDGSALTAAEVLKALPASVQAQQIHNNAVDQQLLASGADITPAQIQAYYNANPSMYTTACVSRIVADTQAHAQEWAAQIAAGASFASVAKANSIDTTTAPDGGALGCNFTLAEIEQDLGVSTVSVNSVIGPLADQSGDYELYEVTSQTQASLAEVRSDVIQQLQQSTANSNRVAKEIIAFAHRSDVSINPQYGTWKLHSIVPPTPPPTSQLLAAASGASPTTGSGSVSGTGLGLGATSGSGSSSTGSSGTGSSGTGTSGTGSSGTGSGGTGSGETGSGETGSGSSSGS